MKKIITIITILALSCSVMFSQAIVRTMIRSTPTNSRIYVDGREIGRTPLEFKFRNGKIYNVEIKKNNYVNKSLRYRGGTGNINVNLPKKTPSKPAQEMRAPSSERPSVVIKPSNNKNKYKLEVTSNIPKAKVFIDGRFIDNAPVKLHLKKGNYKVRVEAPKRVTYKKTIFLNRNMEVFARFAK